MYFQTINTRSFQRYNRLNRGAFLGAKEILKSKGTKKSVLRHEITFNDYKNCLINSSTIMKNTFCSKLHASSKKNK